MVKFLGLWTWNYGETLHGSLPCPILGSDFLPHFNLLVDMRKQWLIDANTELSVTGFKGNASPTTRYFSLPPLTTHTRPYPELTNLNFVVSKPTHSTTHHIETTGVPVFRRLNAMTVLDRYPIPHVQDFASSLYGCKTFSKLDLVKAYHQIPVNLADIPKTVGTTSFEAFEFLTMPFGLRKAVSTFQRFMDEVVRDFDFVYNYIGDILVASASPEEHVTHLRRLFEQFQKY